MLFSYYTTQFDLKSGDRVNFNKGKIAMRKLVVISYLILSTNTIYAQSLSYEYTQILLYSFEIKYSSSNGSYIPWSPDWNIYGDALRQMQARYDRNHSILSKEYYKLKDLKLINTINQSALNNYKTARLNNIYKYISTWDVSNDANFAKIRNYICEIYSYQSIKSEINLLQSCQTELIRIKFKDPDNYIYSTRYQSIMKTLDKLKNCSTSEIEGLSWERTELENQSNNNSTNNTNSSNSNQTYFRVPNSGFVYQKDDESIQIDRIRKSEDFTIINLTCFPSREYTWGWWVCFSPNTYILQSGKKYNLKKVVGIPLCPDTHKFNNINESLSFELYFEKSVNIDIIFDLIEDTERGFKFYNISR